MFQKQVSPHKAEASVIDGVLIVSMPNADTPAVWRFDLSQVTIGGVEVREDSGKFIIGARNAKGELQDIATYPTRETATQALNAITGAMMNAPTFRPAAASSSAAPDSSVAAMPAHIAAAAAPQQRGFVSRWARRLGTLAVIVLLLGGIMFLVAITGMFDGGDSMSGEQTANSNLPASSSTTADTSRLGEIEPGVPASADDLLGGG